MARWIVGSVVLMFAVSGAANAQQCGAPLTLPTAPSAQAESAVFTAADMNGAALSGIVWRESCPTNSARSIIYVRVTPTSGTALVCPALANLAVNQNGILYENVGGMAAGGVLPFCQQISTPSTFAVQSAGAPYFDPNQAFTLIYPNGGGTTQVSLSARGAGSSAGSITPTTGIWWGPNESGSGYALDFRHGTLVVTIYSYQAGGAPQWYLASGSVNGNVFTATLDKYVDGQCISCAYKVPTPAGNDGVITITFSSATTATVNLPGGRITHIQLFEF